MRILVLGALFLVACNSSQSRTVQGRLTGTAAQAIVLSETTTGDQTATQTSPNGTFKLDVPINRAITLLVGVPDGKGGFTIVQHIGPSWFTVRAGGTIELGNVRPDGAPVAQVDPVTETPTTMCPGGEGGGNDGQAELPYDAKLSLGQSFKLADAFAEKGPQPARVVSVTMDGSSWHLSELQSGAAFTVTQADCDHVGNRDVGRDRAVITWENADGSTETDHLDLRYCEAGSSSSSLEDPNAPASGSGPATCDEVEHHGCGDHGSSCDDDSQLEPIEGGSACPGEPTPTPDPVPQPT